MPYQRDMAFFIVNRKFDIFKNLSFRPSRSEMEES